MPMGKRKEKMSRMDNVISDVAYILDSLKALNDIYETGKDCNSCTRRYCEWKPKVGHQIRFNCPLWEGVERKNER